MHSPMHETEYYTLEMPMHETVYFTLEMPHLRARPTSANHNPCFSGEKCVTIRSVLQEKVFVGGTRNRLFHVRNAAPSSSADVGEPQSMCFRRELRHDPFCFTREMCCLRRTSTTILSTTMCFRQKIRSDIYISEVKHFMFAIINKMIAVHTTMCFTRVSSTKPCVSEEIFMLGLVEH